MSALEKYLDGLVDGPVRSWLPLVERCGLREVFVRAVYELCSTALLVRLGGPGVEVKFLVDPGPAGRREGLKSLWARRIYVVSLDGLAAASLVGYYGRKRVENAAGEVALLVNYLRASRPLCVTVEQRYSDGSVGFLSLCTMEGRERECRWYRGRSYRCWKLSSGFPSLCIASV